MKSFLSKIQLLKTFFALLPCLFILNSCGSIMYYWHEQSLKAYDEEQQREYEQKKEAEEKKWNKKPDKKALIREYESNKSYDFIAGYDKMQKEEKSFIEICAKGSINDFKHYLKNYTKKLQSPFDFKIGSIFYYYLCVGTEPPLMVYADLTLGKILRKKIILKKDFTTEVFLRQKGIAFALLHNNRKLVNYLLKSGIVINSNIPFSSYFSEYNLLLNIIQSKTVFYYLKKFDDLDMNFEFQDLFGDNILSAMILKSSKSNSYFPSNKNFIKIMQIMIKYGADIQNYPGRNPIKLAKAYKLKKASVFLLRNHIDH